MIYKLKKIKKAGKIVKDAIRRAAAAKKNSKMSKTGGRKTKRQKTDLHLVIKKRQVLTATFQFL